MMVLYLNEILKFETLIAHYLTNFKWRDLWLKLAEHQFFGKEWSIWGAPSSSTCVVFGIVSIVEYLARFERPTHFFNFQV